ncbi:hypothetical protein [Streptomyces violaceusniger]|uniref:hypothetical protein n=1 Tax=Streptomyces violaceusniger TaxID=68280 RepID=UPI0002DA7ADE|nr:hypothetical protein [Streptomyces violaceusniger]
MGEDGDLAGSAAGDGHDAAGRGRPVSAVPIALALLAAYRLATGHGPFSRAGEQTPAATLLYRVVHEEPDQEPDLEGVPPELEPLLTARPAKDPAGRPTAARLSGWLEERAAGPGAGPRNAPRFSPEH